MATFYIFENYRVILYFIIGLLLVILFVILHIYLGFKHTNTSLETIALNHNLHTLEKYLQTKHLKQKAQHKHASAIAFKIGNLNKINQTYGFDIGDLLMVSFSHRIKNSLQLLKINHFYSGIRDNTFLLIVYGLTETEVTTYIESLFTQLETMYQIKQFEISATPVAGIMKIDDKNDLYAHNKLNLTNLLLTLEMAREDYKIKHKASYCIFTEMIRSNSDVQKERFFELEQAIKNGEFVPFYQPIVSAMNHKIISLEALCRWNHPEKGYLSPYFFLNDIMNFGLTSALDYSILKQALLHLKIIHKETNVLVPVSVNFTIDTILEDHFVSTITKIIQEVNIHPSYLIIEITEHSFIKEVDVINNKISVLSKMGIKIALDDFGSGYSNLSVLSRLKFDHLKLDRTLVNSICNKDKISHLIYFMVLHLIEDNNKKIVCEGIETSDMIAVLTELLTQHGTYEQFTDKSLTLQGYYFSKPISIHELIIYLQTESDTEQRLIS